MQMVIDMPDRIYESLEGYAQAQTGGDVPELVLRILYSAVTPQEFQTMEFGRPVHADRQPAMAGGVPF